VFSAVLRRLTGIEAQQAFTPLHPASAIIEP
jgi:hypothetical protein